MNIAVFTDFFLEASGGIPTSIAAQKAALEKLGHKVTIFCPGAKQPRDDTIIVVPTMKWFHPFDCPIAKRAAIVQQFAEDKIAKLGQIDVIHVHHEMMVSIAGIRIARKLGIPYVQTMHGREDMALTTTVPQPFAYWFSCLAIFAHSLSIQYDVVVKRDKSLAQTRTACHMWGLMVNHANNADAVVVPSKHFARKLEHYGLSRPTYIVSNGIQDSIVEQEWPVRKWDGKSPLKVLWSSRLSKAKRPAEFLRAVALTDFPIRVSMFGDGDRELPAKMVAREKKLGDKVKFYGAVKSDRIIREIRKHHILVLASYNFDNQPMTMLEALATGLPIIYCDPDMSEIVPADGALLTESPSVEGMAAGLELLAREPERIEKMSRVMIANSRDAMQSSQISKLLKVYRKVIAEKKASA